MSLLMAATASLTVPNAALAEQVSLVREWRFSPDGSQGPEFPGYDDRSWTKVSVPDDFSIRGADRQKGPASPGTPTGSASGYIPGGTGWYRRHFTIEPHQADGVTLLRFEAVYMDADIWVNGRYVGGHRYGYTAFTLDVTDMVKTGDNVVAVRIQHDDPSSRWYAGSGLIRPVTLETLDAFHADPDGPVIRTPVATAAMGEVQVATTVRNRGPKALTGQIVLTVRDWGGRAVATERSPLTVPAGGSAPFARHFTIARPRLWLPETPNLYRLEQAVEVDGRVVDRRTTSFGIRTVTVDAEQGLRINGKRVLLRGGNIHHDNYMLGGAGLPRADERKVELMKAAGYNAIRSAHNPASQATLDAADRLGMLVINEAFDSWAVPKMPRDYSRFFADNWRSDVDSLIATGRNHPSVIMWSIGNEIPEQDTPEGAERAQMLAKYVRERDPTRLVTAGVNSDGQKVAGFFAALDVAGYNYRPQLYGADHATYPERVMYGSESYPAEALAYWRPTESMPWVIGDFVWSAIDYMGEASIGWTGYSSDWRTLGPYPWQLAYCGEIDVTGRRRPNSYLREMMWGTGPTRVAAFVASPLPGGSFPDRDYFGEKANRQWVLPDVVQSWTWAGYEGKPLNVVVYARANEVELTLNGRSLGRRPVSVDTGYETRFSVPYAPGTLKAIGYDKGHKVGEWTLQTAGPPTQIRLSVDRPTIAGDGMDVAYVVAELLDAQGHPVDVHSSDRLLHYTVTGAGTLSGLGDGNPMSTESFVSGSRTTFNGRVVGVIRSNGSLGSIALNVSSQGLRSAVLNLKALAR